MGTLLESLGSYMDISDIFFPVGSTKSSISGKISAFINKIYAAPTDNSDTFSAYISKNIDYLYAQYTQQTGGRDEGFSSHPLVRDSIDALVLKYFFRPEKMKSPHTVLQILPSEQGDLKSKLEQIKNSDENAFFELFDGLEMLSESIPEQILLGGTASEPCYRPTIQNNLNYLKKFAEKSLPVFYDILKTDEYTSKLKSLLNELIPCGYAVAPQIGLRAEKLSRSPDDWFYDQTNSILIVRTRRTNSSKTFRFTHYSVGGIVTISYVAKTRFMNGREQREVVDEGYEVVNYLGGPEIRKLDTESGGQFLSPAAALGLAISKLKEVRDTVFRKSEPLQMASWPRG